MGSIFLIVLGSIFLIVLRSKFLIVSRFIFLIFFGVIFLIVFGSIFLDIFDRAYVSFPLDEGTLVLTSEANVEILEHFDCVKPNPVPVRLKSCRM